MARVTIHAKLVQIYGKAAKPVGEFELYGVSTLANGSPNAGDTAVIRLDNGVLITARTDSSGSYSVLVTLLVEEHGATVGMKNVAATSQTTFS